MNLLYVLLLGHVLGDFYFQSDKETEDKKDNYFAVLFHSLRYTLVILVLVVIFFTRFEADFFLKLFLIILPCIFVPHYIIDICKTWIYRNENIHGSLSFFFDQILHISSLVILAFCIGAKFTFVWEIVALNSVIGRIPYPVFPTVLLYLYVMKPVGVSIGNFFSNSKSILVGSRKKTDSNVRKYRRIKNSIEVPKVGFLIGVLERLLLVTFILIGQYTVCILVLTIKGLARFRELENRVSAEYYIVGTFMSFVSAFALKIVFIDFLPYVIL